MFIASCLYRYCITGGSGSSSREFETHVALLDGEAVLGVKLGVRFLEKGSRPPRLDGKNVHSIPLSAAPCARRILRVLDIPQITFGFARPLA